MSTGKYHKDKTKEKVHWGRCSSSDYNIPQEKYALRLVDTRYPFARG